MNPIVMKRNLLALAIAGTAGLGCSTLAAAKPAGTPVTHGVTAGEVTADSAVIWSRTDRATYMHVSIEGRGSNMTAHRVVKVTADDDYTGKVRITGLKSGTDYRYKVWFGTTKIHRPSIDSADEGRFRTAPATHAAKAVSFAWGGDLSGQNVCRDAVAGFPIFNAINTAPMDFFVGLGDMIYADGVCNSTGLYGNVQVPGTFQLAANLADYWVTGNTIARMKDFVACSRALPITRSGTTTRWSMTSGLDRLERRYY